MPDPEAPPEQKSEAATAPTVTASESNDPAYQNKGEELTTKVDNPRPEGKDDDATESSVDENDAGTDDVTTAQASNPVPDSSIRVDAAMAGNHSPDGLGSEPAGANNTSVQPKVGKRGRPPGSKNHAGTKKPAAKQSVANGTETQSSGEDPKLPPAQTPQAPQTGGRQPDLQWVDADKLVRRKPFSTLLPIRDETYEAIKASILTKGFDPTHPVHIWDQDGTLVLVDGHTRDKAAGEVGLTHLLAFIHRFKDETEALGFAIECQIDRRNLTGGELFTLVRIYDDKVTPGSTQQRQEDGTFAPKASNDAPGKSAEKTAEKLKTTATNVERVRYLHKYADAATKAKITNNELTISGAYDAVRKRLKKESARSPVATPTEAKNGSQSAFELLPGSDVAFATWEPVLRHEPALSADLENEAAAKPEAEYTLAEEMLDLPASAKGLSALVNRRVLVAPSFDLFADEVPAKTLRTVLQKAAAAKAFQFLFTTTNPTRLQDCSWEENTFAGVSIFGQKDVAPAEEALIGLGGVGKWLVIEQLTMELTFQHLDQLDWLVVREGAGMRGAGTDLHAMKSLLQQAWAAKCPVLFEQGVTYRPTDPPKSAQIVGKAGEDTAHE